MSRYDIVSAVQDPNILTNWSKVTARRTRVKYNGTCNLIVAVDLQNCIGYRLRSTIWSSPQIWMQC